MVDLPETRKIRSLNSDQSNLVNELLILRQDLRNAATCFVFWRQTLELIKTHENEHQSQTSQAIAKSLFRDGVITFMGCFDANLDNSLVSEDLYKNLDGAEPFMKWLRDIRDMWIAHRHGPLRQIQFGFIINKETGEIEDEAEVHNNFQYPNQDAIEGITELIKIAIESTENKLKKEQATLRNQAEALHPQARKKLKPVKIYEIDSPAMFNIGRKRFQKSTSQNHKGKN